MFCRSSGVSVTFVKLQTGIKMKKLFSIFQAKTIFNLAKFHTLGLSFFFFLTVNRIKFTCASLAQLLYLNGVKLYATHLLQEQEKLFELGRKGSRFLLFPICIG